MTSPPRAPAAQKLTALAPTICKPGLAPQLLEGYCQAIPAHPNPPGRYENFATVGPPDSGLDFSWLWKSAMIVFRSIEASPIHPLGVNTVATSIGAIISGCKLRD